MHKEDVFAKKDSENYPVIEVSGLSSYGKDSAICYGNQYIRNGGIDLRALFEHSSGYRYSNLISDSTMLFSRCDLDNQYLDIKGLSDVYDLLTNKGCYHVVVSGSETYGYQEEFPSQTVYIEDYKFTFIPDLPTHLGFLAANDLSKYAKNELLDCDRLLSEKEIAETSFSIIAPYEDGFLFGTNLKPGFNMIYPFSEMHANRYIGGFEKTLGSKLPSRLREELRRLLKNDCSLYQEELNIAHKEKEVMRVSANIIKTHLKAKGRRI